MFGLSSYQDQRQSFIPINIGNYKRLKIYSKQTKKTNQFKIEKSHLDIDTKLRVHIYPFGLIVKYIIFNISSNLSYSSNDLIHFLASILKKNYNNDLEYIFKEYRFQSITQLLRFVDNRIESSIYKKGSNKKIALLSNELTSISCLNTKHGNESVDQTFDFKEIIGILDKNLKWKFFSDAFIKKYGNVYDKYEGDFLLSNTENLLISFGLNYKNNAHKVRVVLYCNAPQ
jgi:hypothetical protein